MTRSENGGISILIAVIRHCRGIAAANHITPRQDQFDWIGTLT
jgi:hypothetical protein